MLYRHLAAWLALALLLPGGPGRAAVEEPTPAIAAFEPAGPGQCRLVKLEEPTWKPVAMGVFRGKASAAQVAWGPEGQLLVWFRHELEDARYREPAGPIFHYTGGGPASWAELKVPADLQVEEVGFDQAGWPAILGQARVGKPIAGKWLEWRHRRYPLQVGDDPTTLVEARTWQGENWVVGETAAANVSTEAAWDDVYGVLKSFRHLGYRSPALLHAAAANAVAITEPRRLKALAASQAPASRSPSWSCLAFGDTIAAFPTRVEEGERDGSELRFEVAGRPLVPAGLGRAGSGQAAPELRGPFLLWTHYDDGSNPRLYDLRNRSLLYASDRLVGAVLWR